VRPPNNSIAICHLLAVLIDVGALVAVQDRFAALVAVQNVLKLGRAAVFAWKRCPAMALAKKRLGEGRDLSPVGLTVVLDDDLVIGTQAAMEHYLRWFEAGFVALVSATPDKLCRQFVCRIEMLIAITPDV